MSDLICHVAKLKAARSVHSIADVIPFLSVFNVPFESNASIKPKIIFSTRYKENNIRNIFRVSTFQQLFPNTYYAGYFLTSDVILARSDKLFASNQTAR